MVDVMSSKDSQLTWRMNLMGNDIPEEHVVISKRIGAMTLKTRKYTYEGAGLFLVTRGKDTGVITKRNRMMRLTGRKTNITNRYNPLYQGADKRVAHAA